MDVISIILAKNKKKTKTRKRKTNFGGTREVKIFQRKSVWRTEEER